MTERSPSRAEVAGSEPAPRSTLSPPRFIQWPNEPKGRGFVVGALPGRRPGALHDRRPALILTGLHDLEIARTIVAYRINLACRYCGAPRGLAAFFIHHDGEGRGAPVTRVLTTLVADRLQVVGFQHPSIVEEQWALEQVYDVHALTRAQATARGLGLDEASWEQGRADGAAGKRWDRTTPHLLAYAAGFRAGLEERRRNRPLPVDHLAELRRLVGDRFRD